MKVKIVNNGMNTRDCKVFIDDHDMTRNLTEIDVKIKGGEIPTLKLAFVPDEIEIEGDYEVLKKIPQEKNENIFTLKDVLNLSSYEEIVEYFKKENKNIFIKELNVESICQGYIELELVYYDGTSKRNICERNDYLFADFIPVEKRLKLPICTPIKTVLEIMEISRKNSVEKG
ncbi:hypothetical protein [Clostridium neonatale]|uniref:hypothetical protein n=1 Tax=Clostridium neonatale TaxID=137838 RepID=UPI001DFFC8E7|nr:hypothetical protein [Clostridium neonatale]CAG9714902.1 hypothetical protein CNEO_2680004 [Clostridium neonatale]